MDDPIFFLFHDLQIRLSRRGYNGYRDDAKIYAALSPLIMIKTFQLNADQKHWAKRAQRRHGRTVVFWRNLIEKQKGLCSLTGAKLFFDSNKCLLKKGSEGCHPLYAAVDHVHPGSRDVVQILCYDVNDLKGHLPLPLFQALSKTKAWGIFVKKWQRMAKKSPNNIGAFKKLITKGA